MESDQFIAAAVVFYCLFFCCVKLKTSVLHSSSSLCAVVGTNLSIPCGRINPSSTAGLHQRAAPSLSSFCSCTEPLPRAQSAQTFTYFPLQGFISRGWVTFPFKLQNSKHLISPLLLTLGLTSTPPFREYLYVVIALIGQATFSDSKVIFQHLFQ